MAGMPTLSQEEYDIHTQSQERIHPHKDSNEQRRTQTASADAEAEPDSISEETCEAENETSQKVPSTQCLFCNLDSPTLNTNIDHMSSTHGLFIPSLDRLSDLESFLGYLATIVFQYNECLYCSLAKGTVDGVQTHMRDKGHCMIQMSAESELLDFWQLSDSEEESQNAEEERTKSGAIKLSETEMRLPSGIVINSRSDTTQLRTKPGLAQSRTKGLQHRVKRDEMRSRAITAGEDQEGADERQNKPLHSSDRRVVVRGEMGLAGVSESQRLALQITEKKMRRREAVAKAALRYAMEQEPVKTKYYKVRDHGDEVEKWLLIQT